MQLLTIAKLLLRFFASLLNTPRKMHKSKLSQNFYTIGRNNELKEISSNLNFYYRGENPNKDVKTLASGIYQIDGGNEAYTPTRWGMLIVFSAPNYGYALFTHTDGSVYVRTWSQRNGSYYIDWKKLSN